MIPTSITLNKESGTTPNSLTIQWDDGHTAFISLTKLRNTCPCAGCQGETVLLKEYKPLPQPELPGKYLLKNIQQVGAYALSIAWGDGHNTGIYTWDHLRRLCECERCHK